MEPGSRSQGDCHLKDKKCIACRYQKCLHIGMDPLLVQVREDTQEEGRLRVVICPGFTEEKTKAGRS